MFTGEQICKERIGKSNPKDITERCTKVLSVLYLD